MIFILNNNNLKKNLIGETETRKFGFFTWKIGSNQSSVDEQINEWIDCFSCLREFIQTETQKSY